LPVDLYMHINIYVIMCFIPFSIKRPRYGPNLQPKVLLKNLTSRTDSKWEMPRIFLLLDNCHT
jgi:hypothetical protein